jgi:hypothetical protein
MVQLVQGLIECHPVGENGYIPYGKYLNVGKQKKNRCRETRIRVKPAVNGGLK